MVIMSLSSLDVLLQAQEVTTATKDSVSQNIKNFPSGPLWMLDQELLHEFGSLRRKSSIGSLSSITTTEAPPGYTPLEGQIPLRHSRGPGLMVGTYVQSH